MVVGIISEYNPFHLGHKYQIDKIREEINDAKIVAIMSGNTVERGEFSIFDKQKRAEIAISCGIDAVFEMPFPYSCSTAEIFASAGVEIATKLGCDYLYFGTEKCNIEYLTNVASAVDSPEFERLISDEIKDKSQSYITAKEKALKNMGFDSLMLSNDMLAVEYIRAINAKKSPIIPRAIKRVGAGYNDKNEQEIMSSTAIREYIYNENKLLSVPNNAKCIYEKAILDGEILDNEKALDFLHKMALVLPREAFDSAFDSSKEIGAIIKDASLSSINGKEFVSNLNSKAYTSARIKRALLYAVFSVKNIDKAPKFTFLLAANKSGREIISKSSSDLTIITKHSDGKELDFDAKSQLELSYQIDKIYLSLLKSPKAPKNAYKTIPLIK